VDLISIISSFRSPRRARPYAARVAGVISALSSYLLRKALESQLTENFFLTRRVRSRSLAGQVSDAACFGRKRHAVT
jgi:hypothetical protein